MYIVHKVLQMSDRRYPTRPIVGVGTVVMDCGMVLMIQRGKPPRQGSWSLPGGAQELGETMSKEELREMIERADSQGLTLSEACNEILSGMTACCI